MTQIQEKQRAGRNRTITLSQEEQEHYKTKLVKLHEKVDAATIINKTIQQDLFETLDHLPDEFVDVLFVDPPYNLTKSFNGKVFNKMSNQDYIEWLDSWFSKLVRTLKSNASVYVCGDWVSSSAIFEVVSKYLIIHNRITWEREKGRGAKSNWKNASEDIWFATKSKDYKFYVDRVKLKRKVITPYKDDSGAAKDWETEADGKFRLTFPSNMWTDLSVPFWSMPENTDHPTQKPEKLLAKIILASSDEGDVIFDPFSGSGTTSVTAKKLNRNYCGIELDEVYGCLIEKRLEMANENKNIQGYVDGVFWERNAKIDKTKE